MEALDGNAIGGRLMAVFGADMTGAKAACAQCGATFYVAELVVYLQAPGTIGRCPSCSDVVLVLAEIRGITCVDLRGLTSMALE
jgi:Family of unknown function (DUF6510)